MQPRSPDHRKPRVIVFDVGGVLIDWDPENLFRNLIPDDAERRFFLTHVCPRIWNNQQDLGLHTWAEAVQNRIALYPAFEAHIRAYDTRWPEMVKGPVSATVVIKDKLRAAGLPLYAITNFSREKWAVSQNLWPFLKDFDGIVVSGEEKMLKPDPAIYHLLCTRYGLEAAECLFIDDVLENVEAAKSVGMMAHHFANPENLRETLQNLLEIDLVS
ncbi:MAG: HAD family phosphatase [Proteobacteria bacterium]|nr:HAD family phosphatase [Pseudomonadota bacterium]